MSQILSSSIHEILNHYETIVIGSGYGGGVAAARLAEKGIQVCILERGKEIQTGEFPKTLKELLHNGQMHKDKKVFGKKNSLFDYRYGKDISVLVGCGLGGTSLINANVGFEIDHDTLNQPQWPKEFKEDLSPFYIGLEKAKAMLAPTTFPSDNSNYPPLIKTNAMQKVADKLNAPLKKLPLYVSFENKTNHAGVSMNACNGCGDCISGCNVGAKNTVDKNYLPYAKSKGAKIFCSTTVEHIAKTDSGYLLTGYHLLEDDSKKQFHLSCRQCFIACGTLGSTELLLRSQEKNNLSITSVFAFGFGGGIGESFGGAIEALKSASHGSITLLSLASVIVNIIFVGTTQTEPLRF